MAIAPKAYYSWYKLLLKPITPKSSEYCALVVLSVKSMTCIFKKIFRLWERGGVKVEKNFLLGWSRTNNSSSCPEKFLILRLWVQLRIQGPWDTIQLTTLLYLNQCILAWLKKTSLSVSLHLQRSWRRNSTLPVNLFNKVKYLKLLYAHILGSIETTD